MNSNFPCLFFSGYLKAKQHLQEGNYGSIVECCSNELANPLTPHKVESLLLRATLYQLRGESKKAMDDLTALINIENCPLKVRQYINIVIIIIAIIIGVAIVVYN